MRLPPYVRDEPNVCAAGENHIPDQLTAHRYYYLVERDMEIRLGEKPAFLCKLDDETGND
jgi:putative ATPase